MSIDDCLRRSKNKAVPNASYCCCRAPELRREQPGLSQHDAFRIANEEWKELNA